MICVVVLVLVTLSTFSPTLCLRVESKFDQVVHYDPWEDKSVDSAHRGARDIRSYHGLFADNPIKPLHQKKRKKGAAVSHATASNSTQCPDNVSGSKQIMFIHIPKTGGESVEAAFDLRKRHGMADLRHEQFFNGNGTKREDIVVISVIRNPFSRTWSWFKFCVHGWRGQLPTPGDECAAARRLVSHLQNSKQLDESTVREAFLSWLSMLDKNEHNRFHGGLWPWKLWTPMSEWLVDRGTNTIVPDYIIRFETYHQDWDELCECLGLHIALPNENGSGGDDGIQAGVHSSTVHFLASLGYRNIYSDKSEAIVLKWFADDFTRFAYSQSAKAD